MLLIALSLPLMILSYMDLIHVIDYGAHASAGTIGALFDTDPNEAKEFFLSVSRASAPALIFYLLCSFGLVMTYPKGQARPLTRRSVFIASLLIAIPAINFYLQGKSRYSTPMTPIKALFDYRREAQTLESLLAKRQHFRFLAESVNDGSATTHFVLILGESVRRDHLQQYGYPRKTSPRLASRKDLLVFTNTVSSANQTRRAVKIMLSPATAEDPSIFYKSGTILGLANEAGLISNWLSNQAPVGIYDTEVSSIAREADQTRFFNTGLETISYDEKLLPALTQAIEAVNGTSLTVVHLMGSHAAYYKRYPKEFDIFRDTPPRLPPKVSSRIVDAINSYDNSLAYTDFVVSKIIEQLDKTGGSSCAIYTSDHGEVLGEENGRIGHGFPSVRRPEAEVPFLVWCSKRYRLEHPKVWQTLEKNRDKPFGTEHLFDTLADLMKIDYPQKHPELSIANEEFIPPKVRFLLGTNDHPVLYSSLQK